MFCCSLNYFQPSLGSSSLVYKLTVLRGVHEFLLVGRIGVLLDSVLGLSSSVLHVVSVDRGVLRVGCCSPVDLALHPVVALARSLLTAAWLLLVDGRHAVVQGLLLLLVLLKHLLLRPSPLKAVVNSLILVDFTGGFGGGVEIAVGVVLPVDLVMAALACRLVVDLNVF